jgi:carboxypeptidase C (cathepsin A)
MMHNVRVMISAIFLACLSHPGHAQDAAPQAVESSPKQQSDHSTSETTRQVKQGSSSSAGVLGLLPADSVTEHVLNLGSQTLSYKATTGTLNLYGQDGNRSAAVFYTSYVADHHSADRPLTFVFNGGPGAASAFLHLGLVGPKILDFGPTGRDGANAKLVDNPQSWLAFTDLVLIDPIGTGWSRAAKSDDAKNFYGVRQDAQAIAKTIALTIAHSGRSSPIYLFGESYGGLRAVKVANVLQQDQGIAVSGIVMLSPLLEGPLTFGANRFALGAALQLPSLAAAEMERGNGFSKDNVDAAEQFAMHDFLIALAGPPLKGAAADMFYERVAELTGLPIETIRKTRGFIRDEFIKHLRRGEGSVVSRYDAAFTAPDPFPESDTAKNDDPILDGFVRSYGGAFVQYARDQLGYKTEMTYTLLGDGINERWDWGGGGRSQASASDDLRQLLTLNPSMRVLIAQGYSDLVVPYAANKYVVDHLPEDINRRITFKLYRGGHMLYTRQPSRAEFTADAKAFYVDGRR